MTRGGRPGTGAAARELRSRRPALATVRGRPRFDTRGRRAAHRRHRRRGRPLARRARRVAGVARAVSRGRRPGLRADARAGDLARAFGRPLLGERGLGPFGGARGHRCVAPGVREHAVPADKPAVDPLAGRSAGPHAARGARLDDVRRRRADVRRVPRARSRPIGRRRVQRPLDRGLVTAHGQRPGRARGGGPFHHRRGRGAARRGHLARGEPGGGACRIGRGRADACRSAPAKPRDRPIRLGARARRRRPLDRRRVRPKRRPDREPRLPCGRRSDDRDRDRGRDAVDALGHARQHGLGAEVHVRRERRGRRRIGPRRQGVRRHDERRTVVEHQHRVEHGA